MAPVEVGNPRPVDLARALLASMHREQDLGRLGQRYAHNLSLVWTRDQPLTSLDCFAIAH